MTDDKRSESSDGVIAQLPKLSALALRATLTELMPRLDAALNFTEKVLASDISHENPADQDRTLREALACVRVNRREICERFRLAMARAVEKTTQSDQPRAKASRQPVQNQGKISIVDDAQFDLSVALSSLLSRATGRTRDALTELDRILHNATGETKAEQSNPLGPHALTRAFTTATAPLAIPISVRLLLVESFEMHVIEDLGVCYAAVLAVVEERRGASATSSARVAEDTLPLPAVDDAAQDSRDGTADFEWLRGLLGRISPPTGARTAAASTTPELLQRLSQVTAALPSAALYTGNDGLAAYVRQMAERLQPDFATASAAHQDTLRLVTSLFEHILRDANHSHAVKLLIARLQMPVLKVAIVDASLFDDAEHPVRRFMNLIGVVGVGWPLNSDALPSDKSYQQVEEIVARVIDAFTNDVELFHTATNEIQQIIDRDRQRAEVLERRVRNDALGRARYRGARGAAYKFINERSAGLNLPRVVRDFLQVQWARVLTFVWVRFGDDSTAWSEVTQCHLDLLEQAQPSADAADLLRRRDAIPPLLERVNLWLKRLGASEREISDVLDALSTMFEELLRHDQAWFGEPSNYDVLELEIMEEIAITEVPSASALRSRLAPELVAQIDALQPGLWVELDDGGAQPIRARMSVFVEGDSRYVFVGADGKIHTMQFEEIAEALGRKSLRLLDEREMVERAINSLIDELRHWPPPSSVIGGRAHPS